MTDPDAPAEPPAGLDDAFDAWMERFRRTRRMDGGAEAFRAALRERLRAAGADDAEAKLLEVNLLGSISSWMEFALDERQQGRNVVPDFARHLRHAFLVHCRRRAVDPDMGVAMALELATAIMDLACSFQRHLGRKQP